MLLSELKAPFHRDGWVYEEKYDGYRILAVKDAGQVTLWSRNGKDLTRSFSGVARAIASMPAKTIILDGEIAVIDQDLVSHLGYLRPGDPSKLLTPPVFVAFDCLQIGRMALRAQPLTRRRELLEEHVAGFPGPITVARRLSPNGLEAWEQVKEHGWEGLVAKDAGSVDQSTRPGQERHPGSR
jgi:bifunctional non-homologous end joining protein LigD